MEIKSALDFLLEKTNNCDGCNYVNYCNKLSRKHGLEPCVIFEDLIKEEQIKLAKTEDK